MSSEVTELLNVIDHLLDWALANRGTRYEFVRCYTYGPGQIPDVIRNAKRALKRRRRP